MLYPYSNSLYLSLLRYCHVEGCRITVMPSSHCVLWIPVTWARGLKISVARVHEVLWARDIQPQSGSHIFWFTFQSSSWSRPKLLWNTSEFFWCVSFEAKIILLDGLVPDAVKRWSRRRLRSRKQIFLSRLPMMLRRRPCTSSKHSKISSSEEPCLHLLWVNNGEAFDDYREDLRLCTWSLICDRRGYISAVKIFGTSFPNSCSFFLLFPSNVLY